jgi:hypothetical protein
MNTLPEAQHDGPAFGHRLLADELQRTAVTAGEQRVWTPNPRPGWRVLLGGSGAFRVAG